MRPLRVPVDQLREGDQELDREASHYVLTVHRLRAGMPLVLFDAARGTEADATLSGVKAKAAICRVAESRRSQAIPLRPTTLIQSLAKGDKLERVVRDATALGVTRVIAATARRSVPRFDVTENELRRERWTRIAVEAARQSGRGNIPELVGPWDLQRAAEAAADCQLRLMLAPNAPVRLRALLAERRDEAVAVCIGPEGGFEPIEEELLVGHGFVPVRFGDFILRTETAATAVLGALVDFRIA